MDILDRLNYLLRSVLEEPSVAPYHRGPQNTDPDWREAWNELDEYMREGSVAAAHGDSASTARHTNTNSTNIPSQLRKDFETLEIRPGAPIKEVRRQFRRELARYHPDRFADDPEKFRAATAVTRELIQSYRRIRDYYGVEGT